MRIELVRRPQHSALFSALSPFIALGLTLIAGAIMFSLLRQEPARRALLLFHRPADRHLGPRQPLAVARARHQGARRSILIAVGLSVCYPPTTGTSAPEGQFIAGAIAGSFIPVLFPEFQTWAAAADADLRHGGGAAYAAIPPSAR